MGYRTPTCPIARSCGGCEWLSVPYPIQLKRKQQQVVELLGPLGEKFGVSVEDIRGMKEPRAFRHKAATPFAPGTRGRVRSGFYAAGTHRIVACKACLRRGSRSRNASPCRYPYGIRHGRNASDTCCQRPASSA